MVDGQYAGGTAQYSEHARQRLDIAVLTFFQGFRKVYVGEQVGLQPGRSKRRNFVNCLGLDFLCKTS